MSNDGGAGTTHPAPPAAAPPSIAPYRDARLPTARRVEELLARMTLEEKAAQMMCVWREKANTLVDGDGGFDVAKARAAFAHGNGIGQVGRPSDAGAGLSPREGAELTNAIQRFFVGESRLGIPVIFHEECLHGHAAPGATSFPQPIGLGATFNPELVEALYTITALEARVRGTHQALTPVVDVARDPRWGRVEETFGEDPYLVARMGIAAVRGFQGDATFRDKTRVIATLKHFVAHGQPESGMNCAPANVSMRVLRETFLSTFRAAIQQAGALSVMASYNEVDGVPAHANRWLLRDVLRDEWGFDGFVVSDYYAIWELADRPETHGHHVAEDKREACALAVRAGVNIELPEPDCYKYLVGLVREGTLAERELDELVAPMLAAKFRMGLFDDPYVDPDLAERVVGSPEHRALALQAARETITLLKNERHLLPLDVSSVKTIAVIGPNADRSLLGGYSGVPNYDVSVLQGIRDYIGDRARVVYGEGCRITVGGSWNADAVVPADPDEDRRMIATAVKIAGEADVIVLAIGGNEQTSREAWNLSHMGDRASLELVGQQNELVDAMVATGKPVVAVVFNGRPLSFVHLGERVPAILECWYLGQECGRAVAETLFGDNNPSGKLPITIPRSVGHIPAFYNYKPSARRGYLFDDVTPLYPFGFGLSYTKFHIGNVRLSVPAASGATEASGPIAPMGPDSVGTTGSEPIAIVTAEISNLGVRAGAEVVQMYIRDRVSSVTRPIKELKGFQKAFLQPGETKSVELPITRESLAFWNIDMREVVEPGEFEIMVGTSSRDSDLHTVILRVQ